MDSHKRYDSPITHQGATSPQAKRTRRRKLLSCYDCRRRKLQCDRALPACGRCTKAGQASDCLYLENASDVPVEPTRDIGPRKRHSRSAQAPVEHTGGDGITRLHHQEHRIRELEDALANPSPVPSIGATGPAATDIPATPVSISNDPSRATIRGGCFQTQTHGPTYTASILDDHEIQKFSNEIHDHFSAVSRMRRELRDEEVDTQALYNRVNARVMTDEDLRLLLPSKLETDELVHLYLDHYGKKFHILYMPTFWEAYTVIWSGIEHADAHFVAVVLTMIAATSCLKPLTVSSFESRLRADAILGSLDLWLAQRLGRRSVLSDLQFRILLAIAKQASGRKFKRNWIELGQVLQLCVAEGLHREPGRHDTDEFTPIEMELRRRIWATVVELELQASFDGGMGSAIPHFDCRPPTNIHDRDLALQGLNRDVVATKDFTRVTCLAAAAQSSRTRLEVNRCLNTPNHPMTFKLVKQYTDSLQHHLRAVLHPFESKDHSDIPESMLIIQLSLRQYILVLNCCFISEAKTKSEKDFSRMLVIQQAVEIFNLYNSLARPSCRLALELFQSDRVRAALSLCQVASQVCTGPDKDIALSSWAASAVDQAIPHVKTHLKEKVMHIGREQRHLWCVLVAEAYLKSREDPSRRLMHMQHAVEEMSEAYNGMMAARAELAVTNQLLQLPVDWNFDDGTFGESIDPIGVDYLAG